MKLQQDPNAKDRARVALLLGWKCHEGDGGAIGIYDYWESPEGETEGMTTFNGPRFDPFRNVEDDYKVLEYVRSSDWYNGDTMIDQIRGSRFRATLRGQSRIDGKESYRPGDFVRALLAVIDDEQLNEQLGDT